MKILGSIAIASVFALMMASSSAYASFSIGIGVGYGPVSLGYYHGGYYRYYYRPYYRYYRPSYRYYRFYRPYYYYDYPTPLSLSLSWQNEALSLARMYKQACCNRLWHVIFRIE